MIKAKYIHLDLNRANVNILILQQVTG